MPTDNLNPPARATRWCWLGCLFLGTISLLARIGYQIRDVFTDQASRAILGGADWPVLGFCNQYHNSLRLVSQLSIYGVVGLSVFELLRTRIQKRPTTWIGPLLTGLMGAWTVLAVKISPSLGGVVSIGIGLAIWALLENRPHGSETRSSGPLNPPWHWVPIVFMAVVAISVIEIVVISQAVSSQFSAREILIAALTGVGVSVSFGGVIAIIVLASLLLTKPLGDKSDSRLAMAIFAIMTSCLWICVLYGPAFQAFRPTLASFGMLRVTLELIVWSAGAVFSLSLWGHISRASVESSLQSDSTTWYLGLAASPLRGLLRLIHHRDWLIDQRALTAVLTPVLLALFSVATYLTYFEFMDYSRGLHKSTVALMIMTWIGLVLLGTAWVRSRWLPGLQSRFRSAAVWLLVLTVVSAIPLSQASHWLTGNVEFLIVDKTEVNRIMVWWLRNRWDPDRDGYSNWLGGDDPTTFVSNKEMKLAYEVEAKTPPPPVAPQKKLPFVFVVTVETFRADCSSIYAKHKPSITPRIDEFASENVAFLNSYSTSNSTLPSQAALLTGRYPSRFLKKKRKLIMLDTLAAAGYHTLLTEQVYQGVFLTNLGGPPQAFRDYRVLEGWYANETLPNLIADLDQRGGPPEGVCAVFHLNGAHFPYKPSRGFPEPDDRDRYFQCLAEVDAAWGQFISDLKSRGWYDNTILVLTGDHGEEFWEHGHKYHGMYIYEESVRTPIIVRSPRVKSGQYRVGVSTIDIVPTLVDLLEIPPTAKVDGQSLTFALRGESDPPPDRPVFLVGAHSDTYGVIHQGRWKLTFNRGLSYFELYDLANDPGELRNLVDHEPQMFQKLRGMVADFIEAGKGLYTDPDPFEEGR
jgi:hypothetical protein